MSAPSCASESPSVLKIVSGLFSSIGLDPEELDRPCGSAEEEHLFEGFTRFLMNELSATERQHFMEKTIKRIATLAASIKELRPANGLRFSLQQQSTCTELNRKFVASLLAHAFLSTFPNRSINTHPTLQNFNFTHFFKGLHDRSVGRDPNEIFCF